MSMRATIGANTEAPPVTLPRLARVPLVRSATAVSAQAIRMAKGKPTMVRSRQSTSTPRWAISVSTEPALRSAQPASQNQPPDQPPATKATNDDDGDETAHRISCPKPCGPRFALLGDAAHRRTYP